MPTPSADGTVSEGIGGGKAIGRNDPEHGVVIIIATDEKITAIGGPETERVLVLVEIGEEIEVFGGGVETYQLLGVLGGDIVDVELEIDVVLLVRFAGEALF